MKNLTLGSLFDGSGGFPLGGMLAGITPVWASEVEPFAIRVTTKRLPSMKHYGDISKMDGAAVEPVDIISFGSPCQDMSVAGKRAGLDGNRSGLFYEAVRIIKEMRKATNGKYPRYAVWENVPGAFSSNSAADFKAVLEALIGIVEEGVPVPDPGKNGWSYADLYLGDGWSIAYRTLDAQYWGVPQRRRRIYLVADFGGRSAGDILFKSEGLSRYSAEGFRAWQRAANGSAESPGETGGKGISESAGFCTEESAKTRGIGYEEEKSPTLRAGVIPAALAVENHPADGRVKIEEGGVVQTLSERMGTGGGNVPLVLKIRSGCEGGGKGALIQTDKSATLSCSNDQTLFEPCSWDGGQISPTLTKQNAGGNQRMPDKDNFNCVLQPFGISAKDSNAMKSSNPHSGIYEAETSRTIDTSGGNPSCNQGGIAVVCVDMGGGKSACGITEEKAPTLACTHGGEPVIAIEGNGSRPSHHGDGYKAGDTMYTLNATEQHAVSYACDFRNDRICEVNGTMQAKPNGGFSYQCNQCVLQPDAEKKTFGIGRDAFNQGQNAQFKPAIEEELQPTLVAKGPGAVAEPLSFYPQMKAECQSLRGDKANTIVNGTNPGYQNGLVDIDYTVRRLTPTECARLQGFPDLWCRGLSEENPTDDDVVFWTEVWETYARITGTVKPKTEKQIRRWLADPYSDAAEYKLWGNGVALPCVFFVLAGIVYATQSKAE